MRRLWPLALLFLAACVPLPAVSAWLTTMPVLPTQTPDAWQTSVSAWLTTTTTPPWPTPECPVWEGDNTYGPVCIVTLTPVPLPIPPVSIRVVDGDTIALGDVSYRIIGIDTPERRECGWTTATHAAEQFFTQWEGYNLHTNIKGMPVMDRYGRLLAYAEGVVYVSEDHTLGYGNYSDFGEWMLMNGFAKARYDSADGYAPHPNEVQYRMLSGEADQANVGIWGECGGFDTPRATETPTKG